MIVSKPKTSTLFSISIFLLLAFGLFTYSFLQAQQTNDRFWWYILLYTSGPIGLLVLLKVLLGIQIIEIKKEKFKVRVPFKFRNITFDGKELDFWEHTVMKTYGGQYEELILQLKSGKKYSLSKQENTEYDKVLNYMKKKYKKIQK
jgi:hypothetical protein